MEGRLIKDKYLVEKMLGKGNMGEVYLCRNVELGNRWAVKLIRKSGKSVNLTAEVEILKKIENFSLPSIVDIFEDDIGVYIVESYIEGENLLDKLKRNGPSTEEMVLSWARQIVDGLDYLHSMKPHPIIYRDMKPQNIMITPDNRAVIVDFGVSKEYTDTASREKYPGYTPAYAAPEQKEATGITDERTDIYSLGVTLFQLLTAAFPKKDKEVLLQQKKLSSEVISIVLKCLEIQPEKRYQSAKELKKDLCAVDASKLFKVKQNINIKILASLITVTSIISYGSVFAGLSHYFKEKSAWMEVAPKLISVSEQQGRTLDINKKYPNGIIEKLLLKDMEWISSNIDVASVKDGKVFGVNKGSAQITGKYYDKVFNIDIKVSKKQDINDVPINLKYNAGYFVNTFAGTGNHGDENGTLLKANFQMPTSIAINSKEEIIVADNGKLRIILHDNVDSIAMDFEVGVVRIDKKDSMVLSLEPYQLDNGKLQVGIYKIDETSANEIYSSPAEFGRIADFTFDSQNNLYILQQSLTSDLKPHTKIIFLDAISGKSTILREIPNTLNSITFDKNDNLYLAYSDLGVIYKLEKGANEYKFFAGIEKDKQFLDGESNRFFEPTRITAYGDNIYVIDQNIIRRIIIKDGKLIDVETIAGQVDKGQKDLVENRGIDAFFNRPSDIAVDKNGNLIVCDLKNKVIRKVFIK